MATPTQDDFIRSLKLAVRPSSVRTPLLTYKFAEPVEEDSRRQPVTRAAALFMANLLLMGWLAALEMTRVPSLDERQKMALAALELAEPKDERMAMDKIPSDMASALIEKIKPSQGDDLIVTGSVPDIPHPRDTKGYAAIDSALSPGSPLSVQEKRRLQKAVRETSLLAYEMHLSSDLEATGAIAPLGSDNEPRQPRAQILGQSNRATVRRVDVNMDKPPLRGSL